MKPIALRIKAGKLGARKAMFRDKIGVGVGVAGRYVWVGDASKKVEGRQRRKGEVPFSRGLHETLIDIDKAEGEESHCAADGDCEGSRVSKSSFSFSS